MEAGSCGLRRFFTSLYSLPSFLFLLGAASLLPSLKQAEQETKSLQIGQKVFNHILYVVAWKTYRYAQPIQRQIRTRPCILQKVSILKPTCYWSSVGPQRAVVSWHGSCPGSGPVQLPVNWRRRHTAYNSHSLWPGWPGSPPYTAPADTGQSSTVYVVRRVRE